MALSMSGIVFDTQEGEGSAKNGHANFSAWSSIYYPSLREPLGS